MLQKPSKGNDTLVGIAKDYDNNHNSFEIFFFSPNQTFNSFKSIIELISFQKRTLPSDNSGTTKSATNDSSTAGGI